MAENVPKLGELITGQAERDAVHVAVVPMEARGPLQPGCHVDEHGHPRAPGDGIGVVDPFLRQDLKWGDKYYLFLYPGTVISLRHHYRHPVLDAAQIRQETIEMLTGASKKFITECAEEIGLTYAEMMRMAETWLRTGEVINWDESMSGSFDFDDFWKHYEIVTCSVVPEPRKQDFFTCCQ